MALVSTKYRDLSSNAGMSTSFSHGNRSPHTKLQHKPPTHIAHLGLLWLSVWPLAGLSADLGLPDGALTAEQEQQDDHALVEDGAGTERRH